MRGRRRSTPEGEHRPVLLAEILDVFRLQPGQVVVDATVGWGGHSVEFLKAVGAEGKLIGLDLDGENLVRARPRLEEVGHPFHLAHQNFAGLAASIQEAGFSQVDAILADLGFSSMQVDDPERGFSYRRDGPLDMRLDRSRGKTAAQILATIDRDELAQHLRELADEPRAFAIAREIVESRSVSPLTTTKQLADLLMDIAGKRDWQLQPTKGVWEIHPAARTFQALRILVNRELANLEHLLRILPFVLKPGGTAAILSFHSGEDRLVKAAFRDGLRLGHYSQISGDPVRASYHEKLANPRSRSAKLRWARRADDQ